MLELLLFAFISWFVGLVVCASTEIFGSDAGSVKFDLLWPIYLPICLIEGLLKNQKQKIEDD